MAPVKTTPTGPRQPRIHLPPRTPLGSWAVRLLIPFAALFLVSFAFGASGHSNQWFALVGFFGVLFGALAGVVAAVAIVRRGERSLLVFLPLIVLVFIAILIVAELVGHGRW